MVDRICDVAVVGGGIVGAATAGALSQSGFATLLIESGRRPATFDRGEHDPRVYAIAPSSRRFLDALGVWSQMAERRVAPIDVMRVWQREAGRALRFDASEAGAKALGWIVEHRLLADALWSALPESVGLASVTVESARFDEAAGVHLSLSDGSTVDTALVVGAEGAHSGLREAAGIGTEGWSYGSTAVVCHLTCSVPHHGEALQRFLPTGPVALLPLSDGRRSLVWSTTDDEARQLTALADEAFSRHLEDAVQGAAGSIGPVTRRLVFPLRLMHAERYVASRFALVGDSAHVIHPLAGQGLNLGLGDAEKLVGELAAAKAAGRDWTALRTLKRYERARADANLEMMALTDALHRAFHLQVPLLRGLFGRGLEWVDRVPAIKRGLVRRAQG
ncbi:MAG: UbiH/UbiF/VisC/COQ6 family ubiquinone biosynthesis hydroxylase [Panacagrimonas sp.]